MHTCLLAGRGFLFLSTALNEFVVAFFCIACFEYGVRGTVWAHCFFSEFLDLGTQRFTGEKINSLFSLAGFDGARGSYEVQLPARLALNAHVNRHGCRLWHDHSSLRVLRQPQAETLERPP
jgi:hypothetical protein